MIKDTFVRKIGTAQRRIRMPRERASGGRLPLASLPEALQRLYATLEELRVAEEELYKRTEELAETRNAVEAERRRYQEFFDFAPDGYIVTDGAAVIRRANQAAAMMLRVRQIDLIGKPLVVFVSVAERPSFYSHLAELKRNALGEIRHWEMLFQPRQGPAFQAAMTVGTEPPHNRALGLRWLFRDVTAQKRLEADRDRLFMELKAQADELELASRSKSELLSFMAHELRTSINAIVAHALMVRDGASGAITPARRQGLEPIIKHANELVKFSHDTLELSKIDAGALALETHPVELTRLLDELKSDYDYPLPGNVRLVWDYTAALPTIQTDGGKLKHIVQNLINNAIKFAHEGSVTVTARVTGIRNQGPGVSEAGAEPRPPIPDPRFAEFRVNDTGIGISKEKLPTIFEKFYQPDSSETRLFGGAGFGLHIVKRFTDLLGGKIDVESEPGKGTTFIVKLPLENEDAS